VRSGRASVVTDRITTLTEHGVALASGAELPADVVVTATGLEVQVLGGARLSVDGRVVDAAQTVGYKGMMFSGIPNMAMAMGYTNASWTLKCDLTCEYVCRLLNHMDRRGYDWCVPRRNDPTVKEEPVINFTSGYVQRAIHTLPRQGSRKPWRLHQNYALDLLNLGRGRIEDGTMEFGHLNGGGKT
jgi:cation diffusion facilitator CzcD-associated flavoprotein CzcO